MRNSKFVKIMVATGIVAIAALSAIGITNTASAETLAGTDNTSQSQVTTDASASTETQTTTDSSAPAIIEKASVPAPADSPAPVATTEPQAKVASGDPTSSPNPPPTVQSTTCVRTASFTHTYTSANSGVITASGQFCGQTLYVSPTSWTFTTASQWPQSLSSTYVIAISAYGKYQFNAPVKCGQGDIYAQWGSPIVPTATLSGHSVEFQEHFLSDISTGPTSYVVQDSSCYTPPVKPIIKPVATIISGLCFYSAELGYSYKPITLVYDNTASNQPVEFVVTGFADLTKTVLAGQKLEVQAQAGWEKGVSYTVTAGGKTFDLSVPAFASCKPATVIEAPPGPSVNGPTCKDNGSLIILTDGPNYTAAYNRPFDGPGAYTAVYTAKPGFTFKDSTNVSYDLTVAAKTGNCPVPASNNKTLAYTGADMTLAATVGALLIGAGVLLFFMKRRNRRRAQA
jgi:LPXTG-motif cell wall-anchored protein